MDYKRNAMRIILTLLLFFLTNNFIKAQDLPTEQANGFAFPIGTKFTIKLYPTDSGRFNYSIIKLEPFHEIIDTWENDSLFDESGQKGTIEFYFCLATHGKTEQEKKENMKVVLLMKNRTKYSLSYKSDIQTEEDGEFRETSNEGMFPGVKGMEIWSTMIYQIGLHDFKKFKQ